MRVCICDDDVRIHGDLFRMLGEIDPQTAAKVTNLYSGEALIRAFEADTPFDLVFLDIEMEKANGIEAAEFVRQKDPDVMLIFVSAHRKYVFDAFPVGALHYLLKPVQAQEFAAVYRRAVQRFCDLHSELHLRYKDERYTVPIRTILYVEGTRRHVIFHTTDGVLETDGKLSDYASVLQTNGFAAPHTSFLVNLDCIVRIEQDRITLQNGESVYCSVRQRTAMLRTFDNYLGNRKW